MGRVTFDHRLHLHKKAETAGVPALGLLLCSITWSNFNDTDGFIPAESLHKLGFIPGPLELGIVTHDSLAESLITAGFWEPSPSGFHIHDYAEYQITRAKREARRLQDRQRKKDVRARPLRTSADAGFKEGLSVSDLAATAQYSAALPISQQQEPRDTGPFVELRGKIAGFDDRTLPAWLSAAKELPAEWACARALESLTRARERGPVRNEAGYVTRVFQRLREERAA